MGLLDIFKRKANENANSLSFEELLKKAADNPAYRIEFNKRILSEELVVITKGGNIPNGVRIAEKDTQINVLTFENGQIPIFTSTDRIFDKGIIKTQVTFMALKASDLFGFTKGANFILNPYSDYGKEFTAYEIEHLLNGNYHSGKIKTFKIEKDTPVNIAQPVIYPQKVVDALKELFSNNPNVNAAYLAWIHMPSSVDPPHYIFGIDATGDWRLLSQETGYVATQCLDPHEIIDIVKIEDSGLSDYFLKTKPFYRKSG